MIRTTHTLFMLTIILLAASCATPLSHSTILNGRAQGTCVMRQIPLWSGPEMLGAVNSTNCIHQNAQGLCDAVILYTVDGCSDVHVEILNESRQGKNRALLVRTTDLDVPKQGWVGDMLVVENHTD